MESRPHIDLIFVAQDFALQAKAKNCDPFDSRDRVTNGREAWNIRWI